MSRVVRQKDSVGRHIDVIAVAVAASRTAQKKTARAQGSEPVSRNAQIAVACKPSSTEYLDGLPRDVHLRGATAVTRRGVKRRTQVEFMSCTDLETTRIGSPRRCYLPLLCRRGVEEGIRIGKAVL